MSCPPAEEKVVSDQLQHIFDMLEQSMKTATITIMHFASQWKKDLHFAFWTAYILKLFQTFFKHRNSLKEMLS